MQAESTMKVCTDACILGALAQHDNPYRILDIGAGTGVLSLMLAQRYTCPIDAVEIHRPSYEESLLNIRNSPWGDRITVFNQRIQDFRPEQKYDLIISNPPFFHKHKRSSMVEKNLAIHNDALPLSDLVKVILRNLSAQGTFYVLLPPFESSVLAKMMVLAGLHVKYRFKIKNFTDANIFREVIAFSIQASLTDEHELVIKKNPQDYTDEFVCLLAPYYLNLQS